MVALAGGNDGLVGLADTDFTGRAIERTGLHALTIDEVKPIAETAIAASSSPPRREGPRRAHRCAG
jgi:hypothetical protein